MIEVINLEEITKRKSRRVVASPSQEYVHDYSTYQINLRQEILVVLLTSTYF